MKLCAHCTLLVMGGVGEALIGTADSRERDDLLVFLCRACAETFERLPMPSAERAEFIERVVRNVSEHEASGAAGMMRWKPVNFQKLFPTDLLNRAVKLARAEMRPTDELRYVARTASEQLPPPKPKRKGEDEDKDEGERQPLLNYMRGERLNQREIQQCATSEGFRDGLIRHLASRHVRGIATSLNLHICRSLAGAAGGRVLPGLREGGLPQRLQVVAAVPWDDPKHATPIFDAASCLAQWEREYNVRYDRMTLGTPELMMMARTLDANTAAVHAGLTSRDHPLENFGPDRAREAIAHLLNVGVEIDDSQYLLRTADGDDTEADRVLPARHVLFTHTGFDRDADAFAVGTALLTETDDDGEPTDWAKAFAAAGLTFDRQYGPVGYFAVDDGRNPPDVVSWGVERGCLLRRHPAASAVLKF